MLTQNCQIHGADFIRCIAICDDPVRANDYSVHFALGHNVGRHIVCNQGTMIPALPSSKAVSLAP